MAVNSNQVGAFVETSNVWEIAQLESVDVKSPEFKQLLVRLYQNVNNIAILLNIKDTGYYDVNEFVCGQAYFSNPALNSNSSTTPALRQVYRKVINFGALPNATSTPVAHTITVTAATTFTRIYGVANNPSTSFIPLPYASASGTDNIQLDVDATNVTITTASDKSAYTITYVILEWITT